MLRRNSQEHFLFNAIVSGEVSYFTANELVTKLNHPQSNLTTNFVANKALLLPPPTPHTVLLYSLVVQLYFPAHDICSVYDSEIRRCVARQ